MRPKILTNETHFLSVSVSSESLIHPLAVAGGLSVSHFKMSHLYAQKWGSFQGSLTASLALISQRIGRLDKLGCLRAFKQSIPQPVGHLSSQTAPSSLLKPPFHPLRPASFSPSATPCFSFKGLLDFQRMCGIKQSCFIKCLHIAQATSGECSWF